MYEKHQQIAQEFLFPLWQCVDSEFKSKNKMHIWEYFENFVKTSSTMPDLAGFLEELKKLIPFNWLHKFENQIRNFIIQEDNEKVLEILQENTALCILFTRQCNEVKKQDFKDANPDLFNQEN